MQSNTPSGDELTAQPTGTNTQSSRANERKLEQDASGLSQANSSSHDTMPSKDMVATGVSDSTHKASVSNVNAQETENVSVTSKSTSSDANENSINALASAVSSSDLSANTSSVSPAQGVKVIFQSDYSSTNIPYDKRDNAVINYAANSYTQNTQAQSFTSNSLRPTSFTAKAEAEIEIQSKHLTGSNVIEQTAHILSQNFTPSQTADNNGVSEELSVDNKPQLNEIDPSQWSAQTSAYNQKVLNRIKVKPLCDPVGKPLSNPQGTPASKPFLDLPTDFLNTTIECHDGICEVVEGEGENNSTNLESMTEAIEPYEQNLTEELLPEDISVYDEHDTLNASIDSASQDLSSLTNVLSSTEGLTEPYEQATPSTEVNNNASTEASDLSSSTEPLDQHSLPQGEHELPLHVQTTTLNLHPLSQKSASQALHQGANSPIANPQSHLPLDFIKDVPSARDVMDMPKQQSFDLDLQNLTMPTHGLMQPLVTPASDSMPVRPSEVPPAQVTAMALQAAQAKIAMSQKGGTTDLAPPSTPDLDESKATKPLVTMANAPHEPTANSTTQASNVLDPMFSFQQSMAQGYGSSTQINSPATPQPNDNHAKGDGNMSLHSVHSLNKINRMPGLVLYKLKNNTVFYDCYAAEFLGIGTEAGSCALRKFLHMIGRPVVHDLISRLKPLRDELKISADNICTSMNVVNLSCVLPRGVCKGATVYVRVAAFFNEHSEVKYFTFTFMRQMPNNMAFIPDLLTNNTSFAWLVQEDKLSLSQQYYKLLGYPEQNEPLILSFSTWENTLVHPHDRIALHKIMPIIDSPNNGNSFEICYRSRKINGTYIWTKSIGTVIARDAKGKATRVIGVNCDINEMVDGYDRLRSKVYTDVLTGLKNRTYLVQHVRDFIQPQMQPLSILFFDATALKLYNDYLGHAMGDKLLFSIANILNENIAFENELIRISGDEMLCILPMCDELMLQMVMDDISAALEAYNINAPVRMPVFFSMGNITINLNTQLYNRMRMQYAKQLKAQDQAHYDPNRMFNKNIALNRTLAWQNWTPDDKQLDMAYELFFQAVQQADKNMQEAKQANREEHYSLIRAYIEQTLHKHIDLDDKRLLNIDRGMLA